MRLNTSRPMLFIMLGYPGAGKSYFSQHFADDYEVARISANHIRYELFNNPDYSKQEEEIVSRISEYMLNQLLRTKGNIIFDGATYSRSARQQLARVARDAGYRPLTVWIQTDQATARSRACKRRSDNESPAISPDLFEHLANQLTAPQEGELCVVLSGKHTYRTQAQNLLAKLQLLERHKPHTIEVEAGEESEPATGLPPTAQSADITPPAPRRPRFEISRRIKIR